MNSDKSKYEAQRLRMASLCAKSEQCEFDIRAKLRRTGLSPDEIEQILTDLRSRGFVSDLRFAKAFVSDKVRLSGWGLLKVRHHLKARSLDSATIETAIAKIGKREYEDIAMRVAEAKGRSLDLTQQSEHLRLLRHLQSRGFETTVAVKAIKGIINKR